MLRQTEIAAHLDLGTRRVRDLLPKLGCKPADGLDVIRVAYIKYLREVAAARQSKDGTDLTAARTALAEQQAETARLKNALTRGELIEAKQVQSQLERVFCAIRAHLLRFPSKLTPSLAQKDAAVVSDVLTRGVREVLTELAEWDFDQLKRGKK